MTSVTVVEVDGRAVNRLAKSDKTVYDTYMEKTPMTPPPLSDTDPGCFTDAEFIAYLADQGFWVDNLLETETETEND